MAPNSVKSRLVGRRRSVIRARKDDRSVGTFKPDLITAEPLAAARTKQFGVIVAEDTSRLWRNLAEQWRAVAELLDAGVHVVTHDVDTRSENFKLLLSMHGAMTDVYRDEIAYRTRRGVEGRARKGMPAGGRAYSYISAADAPTGQREIHPEQADVVRRIFRWYADGKSPRWIAGEPNTAGVPSPSASWNRTSARLNAKRQRGWVPTAIHGDRRRGTGILNNPLYVGQQVWSRSTWKRSAADGKLRRWSVNDEGDVVRVQLDRLRIIPQELWTAVKARQDAIEATTVKLRTAVRRTGRLPRHLLTGLLVCQECGGTFRNVNAREYGCAEPSKRRRCGVHQRAAGASQLAEGKLLGQLIEEMLSPEAVALLERRVRCQPAFQPH